MKILPLLILLGFLSNFAEKIWALERIRISYSSVNPHASLVWIAEKRGLYAKYGLSSLLVFVPGGSTAIQALASGDIELAQMTAPPGVLANMRGADIVYIAMSDDRMAYQLVSRPGIKRPSDLNGARLGISRFGSSSEFGVKLLVKKIGVDPKDVAILQIGDEAQRLAAIKSGSIDASVFNAPFDREAKKFGFNILADAGALGIVYFNTGICGSWKFLERERGKVLSFLRAYVEAVKIFKNEPEYTLRALSQFTRVENMDAVKEAYEYNKARIPDIPYPSLEAMQAVVTQLTEREAKASKVDPGRFVSDRFLKRLEEEGFVKGLYGR